MDSEEASYALEQVARLINGAATKAEACELERIDKLSRCAAEILNEEISRCPDCGASLEEIRNRIAERLVEFVHADCCRSRKPAPKSSETLEKLPPARVLDG